MLNKQKGNMYGWINYTWNPIRGECPHNCKYCYMKRFKVGKLRLDEKSLKDNLGERNTIFVGSSCDMFAKKIKPLWIKRVLEHCRKYPERFLEYKSEFPENIILGTTLESNITYKTISKAPVPTNRYMNFWTLNIKCEKFVSIEPIMEFDLDSLLHWIKLINPKFVSIGADSQNSNLPEPSPEKIQELIKELKKFTEVKIKTNLKRLVKEE